MGWNLFFWLVICFPANIALLASTFYQVFSLLLSTSFFTPFLLSLCQCQCDPTLKKRSIQVLTSFFQVIFISFNKSKFIFFFFFFPPFFFGCNKVLVLSDLEADYINPFDASSRINYFVLPEFIVQGALCALCLFTGHWFMFLLTLPVTCYHIML